MDFVTDSVSSLVSRGLVEKGNPYGYIPTRWITFLFIALFGVSTVLHFVQLARSRLWWLIPTVGVCCILETIGWGGRVWSSYDVANRSAFRMQITATILAPTPLLAANFILFGIISRELGSVYSRISPRLYTVIFCGCDIISLFVQATGGGVASSAKPGSNMITIGSNVMLGGIIFQFVSLVVYMFLGIEYLIRHAKDLPLSSVKSGAQGITARTEMTTPMRIMIVALSVNTLCIFIRGIYRIIELAGGWTGPIIQTESYFNIYDAAMIVVAVYSLNIVHPGTFLPAARETRSYPEADDMKLVDGNSTVSVSMAV